MIKFYFYQNIVNQRMLYWWPGFGLNFKDFVLGHMLFSCNIIKLSTLTQNQGTEYKLVFFFFSLVLQPCTINVRTFISGDGLSSVFVIEIMFQNEKFSDFLALCLYGFTTKLDYCFFYLLFFVCS